MNIRFTPLLFITALLAISFRIPSPPVLRYPPRSGGWVSMFDGKTLQGWRGYRHLPTSGWDVEGGTIHCKGRRHGVMGTDLVTDKEYRNFELQLEWKISRAGNSGILFHVNEKYPNPYFTGPEYQIIDEKNYPGKLEDWELTGVNYAMEVPKYRPIRPAGAWNQTRILVKDSLVEHWLNGVKILSYHMWTPNWEKLKGAGKWKDYPEYGMSRTGHISLQNHGDQVWFRNIRIRILP